MRNCFRFLHTLSLACLRKILMPKRVGSHPRQWWIFDWFSRREKFRGQQQFQFFSSSSSSSLILKSLFALNRLSCSCWEGADFHWNHHFSVSHQSRCIIAWCWKKAIYPIKHAIAIAGEERKPLWFYTYYSKGKSKNGEPRGCKIIWIFSSRTKLRNICGDKFISCSLETSAPKLSVVADKKTSWWKLEKTVKIHHQVLKRLKWPKLNEVIVKGAK